MSYKDLLVVLDSEASARGRVDLAVALAELFAAHLTALYPLPNQLLAFPPSHLGYFDPTMLAPFFDDLRQRARDAADAMRATFEEAARLRGVAAEWREIPENLEDDPAVHARYADLTILGQVDPDGGEAEVLSSQAGSFPQESFAGDQVYLVANVAGNPTLMVISLKKPGS